MEKVVEAMAKITGKEKVEFYLDGNLLIEGPASEFFKEGSMRGENIPLGLGDRFDMMNFPTMGDTIKLRVMKMKEDLLDSGEIHTLKYFLSNYDDQK
ncbi:hypothetical protein [Priestia megaterium]|jgi:hypothetical protein|uniref:hypothetical protein n=1 Tax=Priestia megaterium TaxID=1404 RepID=UPI001C22DCED|nr:hypothetical protein [Priestia megaterium]MBU8589418.1 hypothetical protein [Priestia megaterium]MCT9858118.1 hypothetical protein [Priestia megaterium]MDF1960959.1 hypothetical protein [Priestia megaterium]MDF2013511.1 hypothetical protein [Priestia megaterium]